MKMYPKEISSVNMWTGIHLAHYGVQRWDQY